MLRQFTRKFSTQQIRPVPGIIFDIDGVLTRGSSVLPQATRAFDRLYDTKKQAFKIPLVFVTNAGNSLRSEKAEKLTKQLGKQITKDQVIMSHTPLESFKSNHDKFTLITGQGPIKEISKELGFKNTITVQEIVDFFPYLDMVDHDNHYKVSKLTIEKPGTFERKFPKIEQIVMLGEPKNFAQNSQIVMDCLISNGDFYQQHTQQDYELSGILGNSQTHLPILVANLDLQWQAEAPGPRMAHGAYINMLEGYYRKITSGKELIYTAFVGKPSEITYEFAESTLLTLAEVGGRELTDVYCIGDNLISDIFGANIYNEKSLRNFYSMLVHTGVFHPKDKTEGFHNNINANHAPRDYQEKIYRDTNVLTPKFEKRDVDECVKYIMEKVT